MFEVQETHKIHRQELGILQDGLLLCLHFLYVPVGP